MHSSKYHLSLKTGENYRTINSIVNSDLVHHECDDTVYKMSKG